MRYKLFYFLALSVIGAFPSCDKMDSTYKDFLKDGEIRYSARPDSISILTGLNRAQFDIFLISAPNVTISKIFWNDGRDSVQAPVTHKENNDTSFVRVLIDNLDEGNHTFEIYSYDSSGNSSIRRDTTCEIFGENYRSALVNRPIEEAKYEDGKAIVKWAGNPDKNSIGQEVRYNTGNGRVTLKIDPDEVSTRISGYIEDHKIEYRTLYQPVDVLTEIFYTDYQVQEIEEEEIDEPILEPMELDKALFEEINLPNDIEMWTSGSDMHALKALWDGDPDQYSWYRSQEGSGSGDNLKFTFDLGVETRLTSYIVWQRGVRGGSDEALLYNNANPRNWEVWGRLDDPSNSDGSWDGWTKLIESQSFKPSASPLGTNTAEDILFAQDGEEFEFPEPTEKVRYLRFRILDNWDSSKNNYLMLMELSFFGIDPH